MQGTTSDTWVGTSPVTPFDHLETAAYLALGLDDPAIDYEGWMLAAEAAWISVAGR